MRMTFKTILVGGLLVFFAVVMAAVFIPGLIWNPPQTMIAHPYTDSEAEGRKIFYSNGCNYCHTQYVREEDTAMGVTSEGGNYVFDNPMILGSERTGPDLSYIGRKRSEAWEIDHWMDPRDVSPLSIMPSFEFLSDSELQAMASYIFNLGDRVALERMIPSPPDYAQESDPLPDPATQLTANDQGWESWNAADLQEGKEMYVKYCLTCHGCAGNGLGSYGGTKIVTPANFKQEPFRNMPDDQWFWHVSEGIPGTVMPVWRESLSEDERWKIIRYVQQIFARPIMRDPAEGDVPPDRASSTNPVALTVEVLDEGKAIFTRECMVCHGDAGQGHGPYISGLQPSPPDFGDGSYGDFSDADYLWRISEGLPWSAMPSWKIHYGEEDLWKVVHYIRSIFTQTEPKPAAPPQGQDFTYPDFFKESERFPETVSWVRGRVVYLEQCAHCHGLAGDGKGWDGQYLDPTPADFRDMATKQPMPPEAQGEHLAKVTYGIQDTAMPTWGEWMPVDERWDVIKYMMVTFGEGKPLNQSVYQKDTVPATFVALSRDNWIAEGNTISVTHGSDLFATYCETCHGANGQGNGPGTASNASGTPAPYPRDLVEPYIFWRIYDGVPDAYMYPFHLLLSESDIWDLTAYVENSFTQQGGGQ